MTKLLFTLSTVTALALGFSAGMRAPFFESEAAPSPPRAAPAATIVADAKGYDYTQDFFSANIPVWTKHLKPLASQPVHYLEVGIFEGRSLFWMLDNVLTHPESTATGIDIQMLPKYLENLERSGRKVRNLVGRSQDVMKTLPRESFDLIYIDGSHVAPDVLADAVLAFDLLKVGGMIVFDDYGWGPHRPQHMRPKAAIDAFVTANRSRLEWVDRGLSQVIVRKRDNPCAFDFHGMSPVGPYCYGWESGEVVRHDRTPVTLSKDEKALVAEIARTIPFGEIEPKWDTFKARPAFQVFAAHP